MTGEKALKKILEDAGFDDVVRPCGVEDVHKQKTKIKAGDIFYTSWGYDQTNYDYIIVVSISSSGKTVKCRRTACKTIGYSGQEHIQEPINKPFGDIFQMNVKNWQDAPYLRGSYPFLHTGTGSKRLDGFSPAPKGKKYYETDSQFGH